MSALTEFDVGPLTWVKGEIDQAVNHAQEKLAQFVLNTEDFSQLRFCLTHLHQVTGALQMVGLEGVARYSEEIESLVNAIEKQELAVDPSHLDLIKRALLTLSQYLDDLMNGASNTPLQLFPIYSELMRARGTERIAESDLFFPDLGARAPKNPQSSQADESELPKLIKRERAKFQRGLLAWLRQDNGAQGLETMRVALQGIEYTQPLPSNRTFWWAAIAFVESLINQGVDANFNVKQLCARIDLQMRRLSEGSQKVAERLLRDVLYFIATSKSASERIDEVKQLFELDSHLPPAVASSANQADTAQLHQLLRSLRELLAPAKESWLKFSSGNRDSLKHFQEQIAKFFTKSRELDSAPLHQLVDQIHSASADLGGVSKDKLEGVAMEMATGLLLTESALENYENLTDEFVQQADVQARRLQSAVYGNIDASQIPNIPLLDEISRRAQEKMLLAQVVSEIQTNLRHIEQVLDGFFRDNSKRDDIPGLASFINQISGALNILELERASDLLRACQGVINKFGQPDYETNQREMELVAEGLSSLGFYIEAVQHGRVGAYDIIEPVLKRLPGYKARVVAAEPAPEEIKASPISAASVEASLDGQKQKAQKLLSDWQSQPDSSAAKNNLAEALTTLRHDADLVADETLKDQTAAAINLMQQGEASNDALAAAISAIAAPKVQAAAPSQQAARLVSESDDVIDAELLEIFLEEAREVLTTIAENLAICQEEPHNRESLTTIRRSFHTLKGSGRMVGLLSLGEVAWALEQVMNIWLEDERTATPALLDLIAQAHEAFGRWVSQLSESGMADVSADELLAFAQRVKTGEEAHSSSPEVIVVEVEQSLPEVEAEQEIEMVAAPLVAEDTEQTPVLEFPVEEVSEPHIEVPSADIQPALDEQPVELEHEITVGDVTIASTLFDVFLTEAREHLVTLRHEFERLRAQPETPIRYDFMRAAHTLCGIARTTGFTHPAELGHALESWLHEMLERPAKPSDDHLRAIDESINALGKMVEAIGAHKEPAAETGLIHSLEEILKEVQTERRRQETLALNPEKLVALIPGFEPSPAPSPELPMTVTPITPVEHVVLAAAPDPEQQIHDRRIIRDDLDEQLLPIFIEEADELGPAIGAQLRNWHANPKDGQASQSLQRSLHTLKGSARMAGAMRLGELTHNMETRVINAMELPVLPTNFFDDLDTEFDKLSDAIERLRHGPEVAPQTTDTEAAPAGTTGARVAAAAPIDSEQAVQKAMLRVKAEVVDRLVNEAGEVSIARSRIEGETLAFKQSLIDLTENVIRLRNQLREIEIQAESQMQSRLSHVQEDNVTFDPLEFDRFTRFQELTRMMAESVNDVATVQQTLLKNLDETEAALLQQARMTKDLQQELMRIRMVPLSSVMERLHRVVRLTAKEVGKKAILEMRGSQVEVDRSVLEKMTAPFEHLLRNAIAHGLEDKPTRLAAGKSEFGEIQLEARQEGNEIVLLFSDDGAGLDLERIRAKARDLNILEAGVEPTPAQLMEVIFTSGFSTASEVTQVAGRGIGMDVVRNEIAGLGGRIEVSSESGKGTTFIIYLPLTLAVTQAVLVNAGSHMFAVPSAMIEQVQELKEGPLAKVYETGAIEWQGNHYPFYYLPQLFGYPDQVPPVQRYNSVLLLRSGAQRAAVHVDQLIANQEIVVKNIGPQLARVSGIAGATVLGNGKVVMIVNPVQLAHREVLPFATIPEAPVLEEKITTAPLIMVVDDSLTVRKITSRLLSREGYQVVTAKDGIDALQQMQESMPDVMLVDIEMPRMDGFELTKNVRGDAKTKHIPIVMITSRTAEKHRNYAKELGVNAYLGKPYQEEELLGHIQDFLKQRVTH